MDVFCAFCNKKLVDRADIYRIYQKNVWCYNVSRNVVTRKDQKEHINFPKTWQMARMTTNQIAPVTNEHLICACKKFEKGIEKDLGESYCNYFDPVSKEKEAKFKLFGYFGTKPLLTWRGDQGKHVRLVKVLDIVLIL